MGIQYFCKNERRRQLIAEPSQTAVNGIDYLEVLHQDAPAGSPPQQTLLVRFLKPLPDPLTGANMHIEGGVRVTPIKVLWASRAVEANDLFAAGRINAAERDFLLAQPEPDHLLVVRTDAAGDFSTYRLRLVISPTQLTQPPGFDPILSAVDFSFKVECPSEFDCQVAEVCPPTPEATPTIDYLAKDYASFRKLILDRLAVIMPDWKERNPADLGIALVEMLAYTGDYLSYFQDAVATEAYLGMARRRTSIRRHARLLDYPMHDGANARTWVAFGVNTAGDGLLLPQKDTVQNRPARLLTRIPAEKVIDEARLAEVLSTYAPAVFELLHDLHLYSAHNAIPFYTWGDEECCLPQGATRATLKDDAAARLRLRPGDVLILEEQLSPTTGLAADADTTRRHAVRLTQVFPAAQENEDGTRTPGPLLTDPLLNQPIVEIEWDGRDALPFPLCLSTTLTGALVENLSAALGNVALADHGQSITGETIAPVTSLRPGGVRARPRLREPDITFRVGYDDETARQQPATALLIQDPRQALPAVELTGGDLIWSPQRDLLASDRFAPDFVVETESDGHGYVRFGDGVFGQAPPAAALQVSYRVGNGAAGNIGADALAHLVTTLGGIDSAFDWIRNPLSATGGANPEALEEVRQYAPQAFRTQERAVTEDDYARMAERHPEVQKAMATRRWTGSWYTVFVTVDRKGGLPVDTRFENELRRWLERFRLAGHDLEIDSPRFIPLEIVMTVCVAPGYFRSDVKQALLTTFSNRDLPNGQRGFFHPDNFTFGQPVYLSQVVATAMDVPGVQWVDVDEKNDPRHRFRRWGQSANHEIDNGLIELARLEIAQLDNDPSQPENGKIEFLMQGGL